jgi:hypothetical protein
MAPEANHHSSHAASEQDISVAGSQEGCHRKNGNAAESRNLEETPSDKNHKSIKRKLTFVVKDK